MEEQVYLHTTVYGFGHQPDKVVVTGPWGKEFINKWLEHARAENSETAVKWVVKDHK